MATTTMQDDENKLSRYLVALSVPQRRYALYYLHEHSVSNLSELAEYVLQCKTDRPLSEIPEDEQRTVKIDLYHNHLPHLDDSGLVSFDERNKDVRMESTPMVFLGLLRICRVVEDPP